MKSGGNNSNYFPENKLNKLANLVQFKRTQQLPNSISAGAPPQTLSHGKRKSASL